MVQVQSLKDGAPVQAIEGGEQVQDLEDVAPVQALEDGNHFRTLKIAITLIREHFSLLL